MKERTFFPFVILAISTLGCPKRQTSLRLVYAPPSPPAARQPSQSDPSQAMVIEEAPPPEPAQPARVEQVEASPRRATATRKRRRPKALNPVPAEASPTVQPPGAPALEPSIGIRETAGLKEKADGLADQLQAEIARLERKRLPAADRKTLRDAQMFLDQATQAYKAGDFQRSLQLAKKAGLLVSAAKNQ
ncbi:MAG TPA: hypothetical protein VMX16_01265 [Terriglobia bacterium]|nr:hypothetical protein [Terriglobia bacterium]